MTPTARLRGLDALRGVAIVAMIVYHFCFDLRWFRYTRSDFEHDWRWIAARSLILGTFLLLAGVSLVLSRQCRGHRGRFLRHVARIAAAALLVSAASYLAFPATFIAFGVLHAIAVSLVVALPFAERPRSALVLGLLIIAAGVLFSHPLFDYPGLAWLGFMTHKPATEDYVPLFPWTGVLLVGVAAAPVLLRWQSMLLQTRAHAPRLLALLGRHGLAVYLVHQPVLIGGLWLATRLRGG